MSESSEHGLSLLGIYFLITECQNDTKADSEHLDVKLNAGPRLKKTVAQGHQATPVSKVVVSCDGDDVE